MNTLYLLCELDDEHYTEPVFTVFQHKRAAFANAIKSCLINVDEDFEIEVEGAKRVSVKSGDSNFYVTEIKEFDPTKGDYVLVWHHAYDGVGFDIAYVGSYEECRNKMAELICDTQEQVECKLEWETVIQACIDTGNEWEIWTIINYMNHLTCERRDVL